MSRIDEYFKKRTKDISFIELKEESFIDINGFKLYSQTPLPILTDSLVEEFKMGNPEEEVRFSNMINGMIYIIGVDPEFKHFKDYSKALYKYDEDIERYIMNKGLEYIKKEKIDAGLIYLRALNLLNAESSMAKYSYAIALEERAKIAYKLKDKKLGNEFLKEALREMEKVRLKENPLSHYKLGYYYKHFSQFRKSKIVWEKFLRASEDKELLEEIRQELETIEDDVIYEEGYTKILDGFPREGIDILTPLLKKYDSWWNLNFMVGLGYRQLGQIDEAIVQFKKAHEINPSQIDTLNELGICYSAKQDFTKALEMFGEAIKIDPKNYEILCNRGMAKIQTNQIEEAKEDIDKAYSINPKDEIVLACKKVIDEMI